MPKYTEFDSRSVDPKQIDLSLSEIGDPGPVELTTEQHAAAHILEALQFSNDILTIVVHDSANEGAQKIVNPIVEGLNQPIVRGVASKVKRKYVEALARTRTPRMSQETPNPMRPDLIIMREIQAVSNPFSVIHDPNPKGPAWLEGILNEQA